MVISVLIEINIGKREKTFDYIVPKNLEKYIKKGIRVKVPFGKKIYEGFVIDIKKTSNYNLKTIIDIIDKEPILNDELLNLGKKIAYDNVCNLISVYQSMLPRGLKASTKTSIKVKKIAYIKLLNTNCEVKGKKQIELIKILKEKKLVLKSKYPASTINSLLKKGIIDIIYKEQYRLDNSEITQKINTLNIEQERCYSEIKNSDNNVILLNGVTGSGKTEIYIHLINDVILHGKNAIVLVPEISLTTQIIDRFKKIFGNKIAILHSGLSDGERFDEYRKILNGDVKIVVGARSAIFAPFKNIGIIVIDEEHSNTYKQEHNPRYNAVDIGILRSKYHNCKIILGSATPSIENYAKAYNGYYKLVKLTKRANNANLPFVNIIDMHKEVKKGNIIFSDDLLLSIENCLKKNEQVMLLLNKRGYSNYLMCQNCGKVFKCPNCDITLTYHKTSEMNRCHYCGYAENKISKCTECGSIEIKSFGLGTQKVEEYVKEKFPNAKLLRMDADTTTKKGSHFKIISKFYNKEADILIGTQMISKGLDFPYVTLVGVINADTILNLPDFRSNEKTYQLISQVSGRAGRDKLPGKVIIQTYNPDNYSIMLAKKHDYETFFKKEIQIRKKLLYPPYFLLTNLIVKGKDFNITLNEAKKIALYIKNKKIQNTIVLGPSVGSVSKINNVYYFSVIIKYRDKKSIIELLNELSILIEENNKIKLSIDVNPISF